MTFLKKNYYNSDGSPSHTIVLSYQCFYNKNKDENTEYYGTIISFNNRINSKQDSPIFLLYGSWSVGLSQSFSDYSNLIILVNIQHLYEDSKWILCVSNRVNILFKQIFLPAAQCFIKLFLIFKASSIFYGKTISLTK